VAAEIVAQEAVLIARAICSVVAVVDPALVVLGGGIGKAEGLVDRVRAEVERLCPVPIDLRVSALGDNAVVDGCLASGLDRAWQNLTSAARL
jgi:predicted NBD/HSP70 family sugar kinase